MITSIFNVFFMRLDKGRIKPVRHGVSEEQLDDLESFGVKNSKTLPGSTCWILFVCRLRPVLRSVPCQCRGKALSPRFISISPDLMFKTTRCPENLQSKMLVEDIYTEDEIWSCTTCGACEEECPLAIEYIDKMVDLRRGMVDEGLVPQSLQKPLKALEKRGNPYGKMEKKRADWAWKKNSRQSIPLRI